MLDFLTKNTNTCRKIFSDATYIVFLSFKLAMKVKQTKPFFYF